MSTTAKNECVNDTENTECDDKDTTKRSYWENGRLRHECPYSESELQLHGVETGWYENGQLQYENIYQNNKLHGVCKGWYENGQLEYETPYQNSKLHGISKGWYENGRLEYAEYYLDGNEVTREEYTKCVYQTEEQDTVETKPTVLTIHFTPEDLEITGSRSLLGKVTEALMKDKSDFVEDEINLVFPQDVGSLQNIPTWVIPCLLEDVLWLQKEGNKVNVIMPEKEQTWT